MKPSRKPHIFRWDGRWAVVGGRTWVDHADACEFADWMNRQEQQR